MIEMDALIQELLPIAGSASIAWVLGCGTAFSVVQSIKMARREVRATRLSHTALRLISFVVAGVTTFGVAYRLSGLEPQIAAIHGVIVGILYPVIMTVAMSWCKTHKPAVYARLRVSRRRSADEVNHDDTGSNFF